MRRAFSAKSPIWSIIIALGALVMLVSMFTHRPPDFTYVAEPILLAATAALLFLKARTQQ
jgi:ABC-type Na+ efflux pump permease subunit